MQGRPLPQGMGISEGGKSLLLGLLSAISLQLLFIMNHAEFIKLEQRYFEIPPRAFSFSSASTGYEEALMIGRLGHRPI